MYRRVLASTLLALLSTRASMAQVTSPTQPANPIVDAPVLNPPAVSAPAVDPDVVGPARRAAAGAANAAGAPGVEQRIEQREAARDAVRAGQGNPNAAARNAARAADADAWRMVRHNNQWWYYTPQKSWMYYNNNAWSNYDRNTYVPPRSYYRNYGYGRQSMGYRGAYGAATTPYSNGTRAGNAGSNLGADIGAAANGPQGANTGAAIGGAIGNAIGAGQAGATGVTPLPAPRQP